MKDPLSICVFLFFLQDILGEFRTISFIIVDLLTLCVHPSSLMQHQIHSLPSMLLLVTRTHVKLQPFQYLQNCILRYITIVIYFAAV